MALGGALNHQVFDTYQPAPSRLAAIGTAAVGVGLRRYLCSRWFVSLEPQLEEQLFRYQPSALDDTALLATTTARATLWVGFH